MTDKFENELQAIDKALTAAMSGTTKSSRLGPAVVPDEPIKHAREDTLNRAHLASELALAIRDFDGIESVVIGIQGPWGSGKSSLLNLIQEQLEEVAEQAPIIFRFNPWTYSDQGQLTDRFFEELSRFLRLHQSVDQLAKLSESVEEYGKLISPLAKALFPRATEALRTGWHWYRRLRPSSTKGPAELKNEISSGLLSVRSKLIVFIDDVDRLNAEEVRQTFQLIKLNANFANTVYLVAFHQKTVEKALEKVAPGEPSEYLEKIVQVSFNLPLVPSSTLGEMILQKFNELLSSSGMEQPDSQRFGNMFESGFRQSFETIRDVNRYFNLFRFAFNLLRDDTDVVDLAGIEAIALFYPEVHRAIELNPDLFCGGWRTHEVGKDHEPATSSYEPIFSSLSERQRKSAISLCTFLFPKMEKAYGVLPSTFGSEWEKVWGSKKRIASSRYFHYYFQLAVPDADVSQSELGRALRRATTVEEFVGALRELKKAGRFNAFVDRIRDDARALKPEVLSVILGSIFEFGDELEIGGPVLFGVFSEHLRFTVWLLFDLLDAIHEDRFPNLLKAMRGRTAVFTISDATQMCDRIVFGGDESAQLRSRYPDLTAEVVNDMKAASVDAIESAAADGRLRSAPGLGAVLFRWQKWASRERVNNWVVSNFLTSPIGAAKFVASLAGYAASMGVRDKVPRMVMTIPILEIKELCDLDDLADLLAKVDVNSLNETERQAKIRFLASKARLDAGQPPNDRALFYDDEHT